MKQRVVTRNLSGIGWSTGVSAGDIAVTFLRDIDHGGKTSQPSAIAAQFVDFVSKATTSLHIAIYDFRLAPELGDGLIHALIDRANRGVDVKIAYDHTKPNTRSADAFIKLGGDPAPKGTHLAMAKAFKSTKVQTKAILTIPDALADSPVETDPIAGSHLMHNKYIVRDVHSPKAALLTGSANFTIDAWTHQENNVVQIDSPALASYYETDFQELWASGNISSTGVNDLGTVDVSGGSADVAFAPGEGNVIDAHIAQVIAAAKRRIQVASMVITSSRILGSLNEAIQQGQVQEFNGIYDATQMKHVLGMWAKTANPATQVFNAIAKHMVGKNSKPYDPNAVHNFMHNKVAVCDDAVVTGSFNFSGNATKNAENNLVIHDKALADQYSQYIDDLVKAYEVKS